MLTMQRLIALSLCLFLLCQSSARAQAAAPEALKNIDAYIEKAMSDWQIPGLSIAVVKDDQVIYAKGYGARETGKAEKIDEQTLFATGSITKSFTAAVVATLVDEGLMKWDDPVVKYLPDFQLYDAELTKQVTIRDLLSHRTGLPRANMSLLNEYDRNESIRRMRYLKPIAGLRSQFTYQNQMYVVAAMAAEKAKKASWDDIVQNHLFVPLKMTRSNNSVSFLRDLGNFAAPHAIVGGKIQTVPYPTRDSYAPAGALNSTALDLANWLRLFLNKGVFQGKKILSPNAVRIMHGQQTIIPVGSLSQKLFPSTHFQGYGLGWFLRDYRGRKVVEHGGNVDGMTAHIGMLPEENLGVIILSNIGNSPAPEAIMYRVFDLFLGDADKQINLSAEYKKLSDEGKAQMLTQEKESAAKRQADVKPTLALDQYAGNYTNDLYGAAQISLKDGKLYLKFNEASQGKLEHWEKDTFRVVWSNPFYVEAVGKTPVVFQIENGKIVEFKAQNLAEYRRAAAENSK